MTVRGLAGLAFIGIAAAQSPRPSDWLSSGGDASHSGVEANDSEITKASVKNFRLVLRRKLAEGERLHPPVVIGRLITHRGFRELAIVASERGHLWAIDADLDLVFWERQLPGGTVANCGMVAMPAMMPAPESGPGRNALRPVFVVAGDGQLYRLNPATGEDAEPPLPFLPAGANAADLTALPGMIQTFTKAECGASATGWTIAIASGKVDSGAVKPVEPARRVVANGVAFTLSEGASLHATDEASGEELYSSGNQVSSPASGTGLSVANGRVYFTTVDGTLWAFGIPLER